MPTVIIPVSKSNRMSTPFFTDFAVANRLNKITQHFLNGDVMSAIQICENTAFQLRAYKTNFSHHQANALASDFEFLILMIMIHMPFDEIASIRKTIQDNILGRELIIQRIYKRKGDIGILDRLPDGIQTLIVDLAAS